MEQPQHLIDTNSVIDYLGAKFPAKGMDFMNEVVNWIIRSKLTPSSDEKISQFAA